MTSGIIRFYAMSEHSLVIVTEGIGGVGQPFHLSFADRAKS